MQMKIVDIAKLVHGKVEGDGEILIHAPAGIESATTGTITFLHDDKYLSYMADCQASAILVSNDLHIGESSRATLIRVDDVQQAIQLLLANFSNDIEKSLGISDHAIIDSTVQIGKNVGVGDYSILREDVEIGENTFIHPQVYIGSKVKIGRGCIIYPGVRIFNAILGDHVVVHANTVIGDDGFGYQPNENNEYTKIPHFGNVIIEDDVEIGNNVVIDRGTFGSTIIRNGVKLDNLIQIAHNVVIDENTVIAAQTGISGSTSIGKNCRIGGQVGLVGHIHIAEGTEIQAQSGVAAPIKIKNSKVYGSPAINYWNYLRSYSLFKKLPSIIQQLSQLKKRVEQIEDSSERQDI